MFGYNYQTCPVPLIMSMFYLTGGYAFMGALILNEIFKELLGIGLLDARQVVFAGSR